MKKDNENLVLLPSRHPNVYKVVLVLLSGRRVIGRLDRAAGGIFYAKRTKDHLHRLSNSLGVNYELLTRFAFRWIFIDFDGLRLITTKNYLLRHGKVLNFSKSGFEIQIFLPIEQFGREKALEFERILPAQTELFVKAAA
jgi:hypothetical protein